MKIDFFYQSIIIWCDHPLLSVSALYTFGIISRLGVSVLSSYHLHYITEWHILFLPRRMI